MRKLLFFCFASILLSQPTTPHHPLSIDVRTKLFQDDLLKIVVQVENTSDRNIEYLEGFLTEIDATGSITKEIRMQIVQPSDALFASNSILSDSHTMPYKEHQFSKFLFHINKIRFQGDYRLYTYHPAVGLIRID